MISRSEQVAKTNKTDQKSLEERPDYLTTTTKAKQNVSDLILSLDESEKLLSLPQREDDEKQKKDAIVAKNAQLEKMRREIVNIKLAMKQQTAIYVRDKMTWEQERDQLQKELERYKALSKRAPTDDYPCLQTTVNKLMHNFATPTKDARKLQIGTKDLSKSHKCTDCNEFSTNLLAYLEIHRSTSCEASPRYDCTVCYKQFLRKDYYDRHLATIHANKDTALHQLQGIEAAFVPNKRRQTFREECQLEFNMGAEPKERKQSKQVGLKPLPDAFSTYDFETLDMNLKGTLRNMEHMMQLEPSSVPGAAVGQKQVDSPKLEQNSNVEAEIEITKKTLYNLLQNSKGPASAGLLAIPKLTVDTQTEQNEVLSPLNKAEIKAIRKTLSILAPNPKLAPVPCFAAVMKQPVKRQAKRKEVLSLSGEAETDEAANALCYPMGLPESIPVSAAEENQTVKQQIKQNVVISPVDEDKMKKAGKEQARSASTNEDTKTSSVSTPSAFEPSAIVPTSDSINGNARRIDPRQRFVALLMQHPCTNSVCLILAFRGCVEHASECLYGPICSRYICKRVQAKSVHLKTCRDKLDCRFCQPYIRFKDYYMQETMMVLEQGCPLNQNSVTGMSESTREALMRMAARLAVDCGLIGDDEKLNNEDEDEAPELEDKIVDVAALSSSSESLSLSSSELSSSSESSSSSSSDEENSSEGEITSEGWEIVEAERSQEVD